MSDQGTTVRPARNGAAVKLYADVARISKLLILPAAAVLVLAGLSVFMSSRLDVSTLVFAASALLLMCMSSLALMRARRRPLLLFEDDRVVQNVPGGLQIRWTDVGKVDSLVTPRGTLVRLFVADWPVFLSRFGWFARQALRWQRWHLGRSFAPLMIDPTHFRMTESELTALLRDFLPQHTFVPIKSRKTLGDEFWGDVRLIEPVILIATVGAALVLGAERAFGILGVLPPFPWSRFLACLLGVSAGLHLVVYAMLFALLGVRLWTARRRTSLRDGDPVAARPFGS